MEQPTFDQLENAVDVLRWLEEQLPEEPPRAWIRAIRWMLIRKEDNPYAHGEGAR